VIVTATGTLQPMNKVDVGSELSGIVKSVEVDFNDRVKVGQVLARLDTTRLEAQVTQAGASLDAAKARVLQVQATAKEARQKLAQLEKLRQLSSNRVPAQVDMDVAEAALQRALAEEGSAKAAVAQAQAVLETYGTDMSKAVIRSPINGIVLTRSIEPGQTVAAALQAPTLFTLAEDLTQMELHVNVDEADIGKVAEGQNALFTVSAYPERAFQARITQARYGSTTTSGVVTYETVLKVDNGDLSLRPGMTATADITVKKLEKVVLIPNAALRFTPPTPAVANGEKKSTGGLVGSLLPRPPRIGPRTRQQAANNKRQQVWILKDGQPIAVPITIGSTNGSVTEVIAGEVKPGMALLTDFMEKTP
jgi:HlyD family secretion protein